MAQRSLVAEEQIVYHSTAGEIMQSKEILAGHLLKEIVDPLSQGQTNNQSLESFVNCWQF